MTMRLGKGKKGPQVWSYLSADAAAPTGEVKDMKLAVEHTKTDSGQYHLRNCHSLVAARAVQTRSRCKSRPHASSERRRWQQSMTLYMMWFCQYEHTRPLMRSADLILLK